MLGVERNGDAPGHCSAGHTGILQALFDEGYHFVFARFGLNKIRHDLVQLQKPFGILAGFEEIGLFLGLVYFTAAIRAFAVHKLAVCPEAFTGLAVMALVTALVNIALLVKPGENFLAAFDVVSIRGAHKAVV